MEPAWDNVQINIIGISEALKNVLMMAVFFALILFVLLGLGWKTVALILSYIFAIITLVSLLGFFIILFGVIGLLIDNRHEIKNNYKKPVKSLIVTIITRFVEETICVFLVIILYALFYVPGILLKT